MNDPVTPLSASRIKTAQSCSWLYYAKYKLALPDSGNDGSSRGSICHLVFELLGEPKRKKIYSSIIKKKDIFASKSIERLVYKHAKRLSVDDDDNINLIKLREVSKTFNLCINEIIRERTERYKIFI